MGMVGMQVEVEDFIPDINGPIALWTNFEKS